MEFTNMVYDGKVFLALCIFLAAFIWGKTIYDCRKKKTAKEKLLKQLNRNFKFRGQI